jgi:hypothetical protein
MCSLQLDIFLNAEELNDLMRTLDQNENGKIEVDEVRLNVPIPFVNITPLSEVFYEYLTFLFPFAQLLAFWNKYTTEIFL